ncbi:MAG: peroxiredoxin [Woeseiaceae bacterium]|jgi:peroxiredoxin Q/BCP|nr:peroxiredoxin [Woeseiaceae bacterium]|tara:strand:+ start:3233 stop:3700 length:468 start_codon:yes stop_codon:yes gene_type:complete
MNETTSNRVIPNFKCPATNNQLFELNKLKGKRIILYFYPKDNTPGCTTESIEFQELAQQFIQQNTLIFGISRDSLISHEKFKEKYQFSFELLSDEDEKVCEIFDVIKEKNMYGKKYMGIERSTFLLDENGKLVAEWRKVKAKGHAQIILDYISTL